MEISSGYKTNLKYLSPPLLKARNENSKREIASLTKIMTCHLALEMCEKLDVKPENTYVQVSRYASNIVGTSAELNEGDIISIEDLFYAMMLPSGNDAAVVLAENFGVYSYY